jgi:hypothetical protein
MIDGEFTFEPYGSDEQADPQMRQQEFNGFFRARRPREGAPERRARAPE